MEQPTLHSADVWPTRRKPVAQYPERWQHIPLPGRPDRSGLVDFLKARSAL